MKKILSLILVALLLTSFAGAEDAAVPNIEGEWYMISILTEFFYSASLDEEGCFHITNPNGYEWMILASGEFYDEQGRVTETLIPYSLTENALLFYRVLENGSLIGCFFVLDENGLKCYDFSTVEKYLVYNGNMLPAKSSYGKKREYYQIGDSVFIINEDSYTKGQIILYDDKAYAFVTDDGPVSTSYGEDAVSYGYPMYLFISTDLK